MSRSAIRELLAAGADFHARGDLAEAERCFQRIVLLDPRHAGGLHGLGRMAHLRGEPGKAADLIGRALALDDRNADAHFDLGLVMSAQTREAEALTHFRRAAELKPAHTQACLQIARLLRNAKSDAEADAWSERFAALTIGHAAACMRRGEAHEALALLCRALEVCPTAEGKALFVSWLRGRQELPDTLPLADPLPYAIDEPWCRPQDVAPLAVSLLKARGPVAELLERRSDAAFTDAHHASLAGNRLLRALIENVPVCDLGLEGFLRTLRRDVLARAGRADASPAVLDIACALARQCFINEYVWDVAPDEAVQVAALCDVLQGSAGASDLPPLSLAAAASYRPLHAVQLPPDVTRRNWPVQLHAVLTQQIDEPAQERSLRESIPQATPIDDVVSQKVRAQYEENPYPRWTKTSPQAAQLSLDDAMTAEFPRAPFRPTRRTSLDILVAGCGTGQQAIETARYFADARVFAVDLSLSSLAYARRKTGQLGVANIEYAQADILGLPAVGRSFDIVDSIGVLHHMADPFAGWRALLAVLRPGGVMRIGLYSEAARADIVAAQALAQHHRADFEGIRACRRAIAGLPADAAARRVTRLNDFYAASECRDLLFHVQEHRFTIPRIADFLRERQLTFLGFILPAAVRDAYAAQFPKDRAMTNLNNWDAFERERPQTFLGMFQFWVQTSDE